jgi:RNA polymerase-binding transcription factor DksA
MPAKKKTATKKSATKKAAKKAASKKVAAKKSAAKKAPAKKAAADAPKASELLKRTKHDTPAIFKVGTRKAAPVIYTLEDVREFLARKAKEAPEEKTVAKKAVKKVATKPVVPPEETPEPVASKRGAASLADILGFGGGAATPSSSTPSPSKRTVPRKHKRYFDMLTELRNHVRASLGMHAEDTLGRSQKEDSGDLSTSSDSGSDTFNRDFALNVLSSEQDALKEIDAAIERIYNGTYGTCEITGEKINEQRLEAVPFTRFSLAGQKEHEQNSRRRVQRAGAYLSEGAEGVTFGDDDGDN